MNIHWKTRTRFLWLPATVAAAMIVISSITAPTSEAADSPGTFVGKVQIAGGPVAGSAVTLYAAGEGKPAVVAQGKSDDTGSFKLDVGADKLTGIVLYAVARGGTTKAVGAKGSTDDLTLLSVLGSKLQEKSTVNELTTVASAFTLARFINGESISGHALGLKIAAGNTPNLVDPATGGWGKVLLDPLNSTQTTTLANLNTLGSLLSACATASDDFGMRNNGVALMAGVNPKGHPPGTKPGDVLHVFRSGSIQLLTDVNIDPAGNVWAANNWNNPRAAVEPDPATRISTWGGGSGLTVIYGAASPVQPPRMGKVKGY